MGKKKGSKKKKGKAKAIIEDPATVRKLCDYAAVGNLEEVQKIFESDNNSEKKMFNLADTAGECLWRAAGGGHTAIVDEIISQTKIPNFINMDDGKALQLAAANNHLSTVQHLILQKGANINLASTFTGWTALHFAAKNGNAAVVDFLVQNGAVVGLKTHEEHNGDFSGWSALHFAADEGHLAICQFLVEVGKCIIDLPNANGETALAIAAEHGRFEVVKYLVTAGANIHCRRRGLNIVQWAVYRCNAETVRFLVSYGAKADLDIKTLWFPSDLTLGELMRSELSQPNWDKIDLSIYRGSVKLQERASHMRALSELTWEEGPLYTPQGGEPMEPTGEMFVLPKHILHLISAYEI